MQCVFASLDLGLAATKLKLTAPITQSHTTLNHRLVHQASEVPSATRLVKHLGCNASGSALRGLVCRWRSIGGWRGRGPNDYIPPLQTVSTTRGSRNPEHRPVNRGAEHPHPRRAPTAHRRTRRGCWGRCNSREEHQTSARSRKPPARQGRAI